MPIPTLTHKPTDRAVNINAVCAICGEVLDTNEATFAEVQDCDGTLEPVELLIGTEHECFQTDAE